MEIGGLQKMAKEKGMKCLVAEGWHLRNESTFVCFWVRCEQKSKDDHYPGIHQTPGK